MTYPTVINPSRICKAAIFAVCAATPVMAHADGPEFSYGGSVVSNYLAKGFTQTDDDPALQGWAELSFGMTYLSFFISNASFGGPTDIEYDLGIGFRPTLGDLQLDLGYVQYFYRDDKTDYGEAYIFGSYDVSDTTSVGFKYYHEVYFDYDTLYVSGSLSDLPWDLSLSGGVGSDFGTRNLTKDAVYADIGLSKDISDHTSFDLRAHYSAFESNRLIATLSFYN